jgi:signal transduction histidine kinase
MQAASLWKRLTEPFVFIADETRHKQARLLASMSLVVIVGSMLAALAMQLLTRVFSAQQMMLVLIGISSFFISYFVSRYGKIETAVVTSTRLATAQTLLAATYIGGNTGINILYYLMTAYVFAVSFLSIRAALGVMISNTLLIAIFAPMLLAVPRAEILAGPILFHFVAGGFIVVFVIYWRQQEAYKRAALQKSEQRRMEMMFEHERNELLQALLLAIAHDFRTRLSIIESNRHLAQRLTEKRAPPDLVAGKLAVISETVQGMAAQLSNLNIIGELSHLQIQTADAAQIVDQVATRFSNRAASQSITLTHWAAPDLPRIALDEPKLVLALEQLLQNALDNTLDGQVMVCAVREADEIKFEVSDSGRGIVSEDLPHVFEPFYRTDEARTVAQGGVGLGLTIVKMVAEAHGGRVEVESMVDKGTRFTMTLPLAKANGQSQAIEA